jgi:pimeloyl-ACP methyl ester carboxylesterase
MTRDDRIRLLGSIAAAVILLFSIDACSVVGVQRLGTHDRLVERQVDILTADRLSDRTKQALNVVAVSLKDCEKAFTPCAQTLAQSTGLSDEQRLSALSEIWLARALKAEHGKRGEMPNDIALNAYLQSARFAYAYLFFTERDPSKRAFDLRQSQVTEFYNFAVQRVATDFFDALPLEDTTWSEIHLAGWTVLRPTSDVRLAGDTYVPAELLDADALRFKGLRNIYTRDGFGSEFVEVAAPLSASNDLPWREPGYASMTGALAFPGTSLAEVLATTQVRVLAKDPYQHDTVEIGDRVVPLAANYTAAYGVWLARSHFGRQSLLSLFGREGGITTPRVLLMQPYDPNRLTVVMLHGLASSPEAWINVSNEVMGDEYLRRHYQVWEVYYPTNLPVAVNRAGIRAAVEATIQHFDPSGRARASNHIVLVGHSMGGVLSRLLVSSSGEDLWDTIPVRSDLSAAKLAKLHERLGPYLQFTPMPQVTRVIFLASPHRGTPLARHSLARWIGNLIRTPANLLADFASMADILKPQDADGALTRVPNSIDNLSDTNPFIVAAADLPMSPTVHYHTIVGVHKPTEPLASSSDGVVPYASAHLEGAESELAVPSGHSVQETPAAILEVRRILRLHAELLNP